MGFYREKQNKGFISYAGRSSEINTGIGNLQMHQEITSSGFQSDAVVANSLLDAYAKCGFIRIAHEVFDKIS